MSLKESRRIVPILMTGVLVALAILLLVLQPTRAAGPWYVAPSGDDSNDCLSPATPCDTINGAIGKASPGDTIYVAMGTYPGTGDEVVLLNKSVTLSGGWDAGFSTRSGTSIIDGEEARRGVTVESGVAAILEWLAVVRGSSDRGGGIIMNEPGVPRSSEQLADPSLLDSTGRRARDRAQRRPVPLWPRIGPLRAIHYAYSAMFHPGIQPLGARPDS